MKSLLLAAALIGTAVALVGMYAPAYYTGTWTEYCPLGHKIREASQCVILDAEVSRVLVQHADRASGERYLEIVQVSGAQQKYRLPDSVTGLAPEDYTADLLDGETEWFAVNGKWQPLEAMP